MAFKYCALVLVAALFITSATAQNSACLTSGATIQQVCGAFQSLVQQQAQLVSAPDASLIAAINASPTKITPECCNGLAAFNAPTPPCGCDTTILPVAQASGFDANGLLTVQRVGSLACGALVPPIGVGNPGIVTCPAPAAGRKLL